MIIKLKKFGEVLVSRQSGKEVWNAFQGTIREAKPNEEIIIDFNDVQTLTPSWADEFIIPLFEMFPKTLILKKSDNSNVEGVLEFLEKIHEIKYNRV